MTTKLEDLPADVEVAWFGHKWDSGCTEDIRVEPPETEWCHGCFDPLGEKSSGVAARDAAGRWLFYDPVCWGEHIADAKHAVRDKLGGEEQ